MTCIIVSFVFQNQEIEELTKICDELIAKLGKTDWVSPVLSADLHLAASLMTTLILPYLGIITPLQRKKKLKKSTCLLLTVPLCCRCNSPRGGNPRVLHSHKGMASDSFTVCHILPSIGSGRQAAKFGFVISLSLIRFKVISTFPSALHLWFYGYYLGSSPVHLSDFFVCDLFISSFKFNIQY